MHNCSEIFLKFLLKVIVVTDWSKLCSKHFESFGMESPKWLDLLLIDLRQMTCHLHGVLQHLTCDLTWKKSWLVTISGVWFIMKDFSFIFDMLRELHNFTTMCMFVNIEILLFVINLESFYATYRQSNSNCFSQIPSGYKFSV